MKRVCNCCVEIVMKSNARRKQVEENAIVLDFEGYPTCNDVEDSHLRNYNRAHVVINIVEDLTKQGASKDTCWEKVLEYVRNIPNEEIFLIFSSLPDARAARILNPTAYGYSN
jgi:hypothetical protein